MYRQITKAEEEAMKAAVEKAVDYALKECGKKGFKQTTWFPSSYGKWVDECKSIHDAMKEQSKYWSN